MALFSLPSAVDRSVDVLSLGNPNIDLVFGVADVPAADQKCVGRRLGAFAGGTTANVACVAARLGARTCVLGQIGDDQEGQFLAAEFARFNVSTEHLHVAKGSRSATAIIMVNGQGEKALIYIPMSEMDFPGSQMADLCTQSRVVYTMPYELARFASLAQLAHEKGATIAIDVESAMVSEAGRLDALMALSDVVFFSGTSFREIFGVPPTSDVIRPLLEKGPRAIIVTLGADGALAVTTDQVARQPGFAAKVIDTTGAGDCFNGALIAAALEGQSLEAALRFACAAASISVTAVGARSQLPDREAIGYLLNGGAASYP